MSAPPLPLPEMLFQHLRDLCALPTDTARPEDLAVAADRLSSLLRVVGMQVSRLEAGGAPLLIARRAGRSARTLLLYHHYDTAPVGPWRAWSHDPFALAERDGAFYGRGVVDGKGPLIAHLYALDALIRSVGGLPCNVVMVIEGKAHQGSPGLAGAVANHQAQFTVDGILGSVGEHTATNIPLCYSGSKGLLQVRLHVHGATDPIAAGFAPTVRNPLWRLVWALSQIKGEDEDVRIPGFYDHVEGPTRQENAQLRQIALDEAGRREAWGGNEFLFGMSGTALIRAETTLPTCNVSALVCEPTLDYGLIPARASARLDFQLVPHQTPEQILGYLRQHLIEANFADIDLEHLPGGYAPTSSNADTPFVQAVATAGSAFYGHPLPIVPAGAFALPLHVFSAVNAAPIASLGLRRASSGLLGPHEHVPLADLVRHGDLLIEALARFAEM